MAPQTFPTLAGLAFPVKRFPIWSTIKEQYVSGLRARFALWTYPQYRYEIEFDVLRKGLVNGTTYSELQNLMAFYNLRRGACDLFLYDDPDDNSVTDQPFGIGDGVTAAFQLVRAYGGFVDPIFAPTEASMTIKDNGVVVDPADWVVDQYGRVSFSVPPTSGHTLTWTGSYKWYCRFDEDEMEFSKFMSNLWTQKGLTFTTEKF